MMRSALAFVIFAACRARRAAGAGAMTDAQKMERNKKNVVEFYNAVLNEKNFEKAKTYVGATYIQHNPIGADGLEGIKGFINFLREKFPNNKSEIKRVFADGNYVIVHVHAVREPGTARQRDLRSVPARRQRQGARALGRGAADPRSGDGAEQERYVLTYEPPRTARGDRASHSRPSWETCSVASLRRGAATDSRSLFARPRRARWQTAGLRLEQPPLTRSGDSPIKRS